MVGRSWLMLLPLTLLVTVACGTARGAERRGPDRIDEASTEKIRAYTTEDGFSTPWVDHLPTSRRVPTPLAFNGHVTGAPDHLSSPDEIHAYFRELAAKSDRVKVWSIGKSHGGREMLIAAIADRKLLARLDEIKAANHELADPRKTDEARARELAQSTPPMYWLTAGLHSPETGPPEMVMELAYRLAVSDQAHIQEIRNNVVTLITPVLETDGRARMVDWYRRFLTGVTDLEDSPPRMAPYWGDYTAHDNNRDGLQLSQPLTRNYVGTFHELLPVLSLDLHESVPLLYVSTGTGPYNEAIDPITVTEWQWIASYEVSQATKLGLRGVWTWGFYTGWYPGYLLWVTNNHNAVGRFYETFGNSNPGTFDRDLRRSSFADRRINSRQWYRAWPPEKDVRWSLRNNINYMQTAVLASLQLAARNGETLLFNFWQKGANAVEKGKTEAPYGFVIPAKQRDKGALHQLLWLLNEHRIELHQAETAVTWGEVEVAAGDYVVRMDQPYRNFAKTLLLAQPFPKTAQYTPYDDVAWSLDYMLGVDVHPVKDEAVLSASLAPMEAVPALEGEVRGSGRAWIIDHVAQTGLAGLRFALEDGVDVRALTEEWKGHPAGSLVIEGASSDAIRKLSERFRVDVEALPAKPDAALLEVDAPRVAVFHTWRYTQDSGWLRHTFESLSIPFALINKDHLRAGKLRDDFDVIVVPSQGGMQLRDIVGGIDPKWGPMPYTRTDEFPSHGVIDSSEDITGGMGFEGLGNLQRFIEDGGTVVTLGSGGRLVADGGLAREVSSTDSPQSPGSHLTTKVLRPEHPLAWGYPELTHVFRGNLPLFNVREYDRGMVVMQYGTQTWAEADLQADKEADIAVEEPEPQAAPSEGEPRQGEPKTEGEAKGAPLTLSGIVKKPKAIQRKPAILDVPVGKGRVIMLSWNPAHRYQNHHDLGFLANALLFHNDRLEVPTRDEMRARETPPQDDGPAPSDSVASR